MYIYIYIHIYIHTFTTAVPGVNNFVGVSPTTKPSPTKAFPHLSPTHTLSSLRASTLAHPTSLPQFPASHSYPIPSFLALPLTRLFPHTCDYKDIFVIRRK